MVRATADHLHLGDQGLEKVGWALELLTRP